MSLLLLFATPPGGGDVEVTFTGVGTLAPAGTRKVFASVAFTDAGGLTPTPTRTLFAAVAFAGSGALAADGDPKTDGGPLLFRAEGRLRLRTLILGDEYRAVVVDLLGNRYAELDKAVHGPATWELNTPGTYEFTMPSDDPKTAKALPIEREVQLWKGDTLLWQGPIVRPLVNSRESSFQAASPEWYFTRRFFGKADRTNYIPNGDFEAGLAGWDVANTSPLEPISGWNPALWTARIATDRVVTGGRSLYVEQEASAAPKYGVSAASYFEWEVDPAESPEGDLWTLTAYCFIDSSKWRGPKLSREGIGLSRYSTTETISLTTDPDPVTGEQMTIVYPAPIEGVTASMDDFTPQDKWVRMSVSLEQRPTGQPELVQIRLHAPDGAVYWDRVSLTLEESTRFYGDDQALICEGIVQHLQDPAYGKSDLNIGTRCEPTGVVRDRVYIHSEHPNGFDALGEFPTLDNGLDFSVEITATARTFVTHYPEKGDDRTDVVLEFGRNVEDFTWGWDGEQAANAVITLGSGDGSSREEGWAIEEDLFGGVVLEDVFVAPGVDNTTNIETLDDRATERLRLVRDPEILELICNESAIPLLGVLKTGDRITARVHQGIVAVDGPRRIVRMSLEPTTNVLTITTNRTTDA